MIKSFLDFGQYHF